MMLSVTEMGHIGRMGPVRPVALIAGTTLQPAWEPVTGDPPDPQANGEARATDEDAAGTGRFYRLIIE